MKKITRYLIIILLLTFTSIFFSTCVFARGVCRDVKYDRLFHKNYIKYTSLKGVVVKKRAHLDWIENKYWLDIELEDLDNIIYAGYYHIFDYNMSLSVTKKIYDNTNIRDSFGKERNSCQLRINDHYFEFLSKEKDRWLYKVSQ